MTVALALPEAGEIRLDQIREQLIPRCQLARAQIREQGDINAALELARRLDAFRQYMQDRESRQALAAEMRRTEVLIGHLLGTAKPGPPMQDSQSSQRCEDSGLNLTKDQRRRFRLLADNELKVEELLNEGITSREEMLQRCGAANGHAVIVRKVSAGDAGDVFPRQVDTSRVAISSARVDCRTGRG